MQGFLTNFLYKLKGKEIIYRSLLYIVSRMVYFKIVVYSVNFWISFYIGNHLLFIYLPFTWNRNIIHLFSKSVLKVDFLKCQINC